MGNFFGSYATKIARQHTKSDQLTPHIMTPTPHPTDDLPLPEPALHLAFSRDGESIRFWTVSVQCATAWSTYNWPTAPMFSEVQYRAAHREGYELAMREARDALKFAYEALLNCSACAEPECKQDQQEFIGAALKKLEALAAQQSKEQPK